MPRNNPRHVAESVNEATEVLGGMFNTHRCVLESRLEIQKRLEPHPVTKKNGDLPETTFGVFGRYPRTPKTP